MDGCRLGTCAREGAREAIGTSAAFMRRGSSGGRYHLLFVVELHVSRIVLTKPASCSLQPQEERACCCHAIRSRAASLVSPANHGRSCNATF
eukprot:6187709-Pleurochrysis_carterae.AAC.8